MLDPFCGCGTAVAVAERLGRQWIGVDITHLAIGLIKYRMKTAFGKNARFSVHGEPTTLAGARELAKENPYQFQWWFVGRLLGRPAEEKKGKDRGIDGRLFFKDSDGNPKQIVLSVKAGKIGPAHVRDLRGVVEREASQGAAIGALLSLAEPTDDMRKEAASAGFYKSPFGRFPRIQLLTARELLDGRNLSYPSPSTSNVSLRKTKPYRPRVEQGVLPGIASTGRSNKAGKKRSRSA